MLAFFAGTENGASSAVSSVRTSGPFSVIAIVCSKCAERLPSAVTLSNRRRAGASWPCLVHHRLDREHHALAQCRPRRPGRSSGLAAPRASRCRCRGRRTRARPSSPRPPRRPRPRRRCRRGGCRARSLIAASSEALVVSRAAAIRRRSLPTGIVIAASPCQPSISRRSRSRRCRRRRSRGRRGCRARSPRWARCRPPRESRGS